MMPLHCTFLWVLSMLRSHVADALKPILALWCPQRYMTVEHENKHITICEFEATGSPTNSTSTSNNVTNHSSSSDVPDSAAAAMHSRGDVLSDVLVGDNGGVNISAVWDW